MESAYGIMLCGQIGNILGNLKYLPNLKPPFTSCSTITELGFSDIMSSPEESAENCNTIYRDSEINVVDDEGNIVEASLNTALDDILFQEKNRILNYDECLYNDTSIESHEKLIEFVLDSATRNEEGRLVMPLLWNNKVSHLLGNKQCLAKIILKSNLRKYSKNEQYLNMIDDVFKEQESLGIIERIENLPQLLEENPNFSFLPHMPVFRMERDSSKCRVVYLSNLSERDLKKPMTVSQNQAMLPGPCLNRKISTAVLQLRFDEKAFVLTSKRLFADRIARI